MHSSMKDDAMVKELIELPHSGLETLDDFGFTKGHGTMISFGSYKLESILDAWNAAEVAAPGESEEEYHYVFNNCGDLLTSFLVNIGHKSHPHEAKAIADMLLYIAPNYVASVREAIEGTEMESWTDEEVLFWIVEQRLGHLYSDDI